MLGPCPRCHENSVTTKIYTRKRDGVTTRAEYCINGCGYRKELPFYRGIFFHLNKTLTAIFISTTLMLSGCATHDAIDEWVNTKLFDNSENVNWHVQARYLESNYPNCSDNEKALMLAGYMQDNDESFVVREKTYRVRALYVESDGVRIWPPHGDKSMIGKYGKLKLVDEKIEIYLKKD